MLDAGTQAPDFTLPVAPNRKISLSELRGAPVVLAFYPADWTPVCTDQLALYSELADEFDRYSTRVFGVSVDGTWCHAAFSDARKLSTPLLSDFEPKGAVSRAYGVYRAEDGTSERALFLIDADGMIRWSYLSAIGENPGADGILEALEAIVQPTERVRA